MTAVFPFVPQPRRVTMAEIKAAVAERFHVSVADLESARRGYAVAHPRQVAMALASSLTRLSLPQIGRFLGDRDHTTVMHGLRSVERRRAKDADLDIVIRDLERELRSPRLEVPQELQLAIFDGPLFDQPSRQPEAVL